MQCKATTKKGRRCHNNALTGSRFCNVHKNSFDKKSLIKPLTTGLGVVIGNAVAPGIGGALAGGFFGNRAGAILGKDKMAKKKVFISFDFDNDKFLKDSIIGQAKNADSPFEVSDWSMKEAAKETEWEKKAQNRILRSDIVLVMVGEKTHKASGVLKEIKMARDGDIKIVQVKGYPNKNCPQVQGAGKYYRWTWGNLRQLLA